MIEEAYCGNCQDDTDKPVRNNPDVEPDIHAVLPFPVAKNNDELENRIQEFDKSDV